MSEDLHDIDKLFQESIEGHAETPPPGVWEQLDKRLDKKRVVSIAGRYRMLKWVAAALFLISVGMAMWVYQLQTNKKKGELVKKTDTRRPPYAPASEKPLEEQQPSTAGPEPRPHQEPDKKEPAPQQPVTAPASADTGDEAVVKEKIIPHDAGASTKKIIIEKTRQQSPKNTAPLVAEKFNRRQPVTKENTKNTAEKSFAQTVPPGNFEIVNQQTEKPIVEQTMVVELLPTTVGEPLPHVGSASLDFSSLPQLEYRALVADSYVASLPAPIKLTSPQVAGFTATLFFSPNLVSSSITNGGQTPPDPEDDKNKIKEKEKNGSSKSIGALIDYNFNAHWSIGSGLIFSSRNTIIETSPVYARAVPRPGGNDFRYRFNCSSGYSYIDVKPGGRNPTANDTVKAISSRTTLKYVSVPLMVKYNLGEGKLRFATSAGLQANFLTGRNIETVLTKGSAHEYANTSDILGLRSVYLSGIISAGATYKLNRSLTASLMPTAQLGFMSINQYYAVKSYINFYGLAFGLTVKL